jgi:hypothetical protein
MSTLSCLAAFGLLLTAFACAMLEHARRVGK